jgi:hypothetical protein
MWFFLILAATVFAADDSPKLTEARRDLDRAREQVAAGLMPANRVAEAQDALDDVVDEDVLNRTLYGHLNLEDLSEQQASEMTAAAERRVARTQKKVDRGKQLVTAGVAEPYLFADLESELARRSAVLDQAKSRAALLMEIVEIAKAEVVDPLPQQPRVEWKPKEHFEGDGLLDAKDIREVTLAFEKQFHEPFPVSARGQTAVHRAMGFDHTGRIDVAIAPDSPEGLWLRKYLESKSIPYYAFRVAMPGRATAPHIHIGPGSTRIPVSD